jgi:hypothetical protein
MPSPETGRRVRLRLKDAALELFADAIGPQARAEDGEPKKYIILGHYSRDYTRVLQRNHTLSTETAATIADRYDELTGVGFWPAMQALFEREAMTADSSDARVGVAA